VLVPKSVILLEEEIGKSKFDGQAEERGACGAGDGSDFHDDELKGILKYFRVSDRS
jgi:hypothetical protein